MIGPQMSLRDYLLRAIAERSFSGWRSVRATRREVLLATVFLALLGYALWIFYWSGIENHCLWNHFGARCENGGSH
jgi:hypothetical protein